MAVRNIGTDRGQSMKEALLNRTRDSYTHRDDTGMYRDIFLDVEGLQKFKCNPGVHLIDIIPYKAGDKDPNPRVKSGQPTYLWEGYVHGNIGANQNSYVCPAQTYNLPCPICEYREQLRDKEDYDEEYVKSLYPIRRVAYNIVCYDDTKQEAKGIQVWLVAHFHMEKKLMAIAKLPDRGGMGGGYVSFADPNEGRSIQFERKGGKDNTEFLGHQFVPREGYTISQEILGQAKILDQIVHIPTYEELRAIFFAEDVDVETTEPEFVSESEEVISTGIDTPLETVTPTEKIKEAPAPIAQPSSSRLIRRRGGQPTPTGEKKCPFNGTFGVDCEELKECGDCKEWDDCSVKRDELRAKAASTPKPLTEPVKPSRPTPAPVGARRGMIPRR